MYDYLIVGAGLYGAVFAHEAAAAGKRVLVLEKRAHVGGNAHTENVGGIWVHRYGAHIFHTDDREVWDYVNRFAEFNRFTNAPLAQNNGKLYHLPFNMNTFYELWGVREPAQAQAMIDSQRGEITGTPANLEEQAISLVGRDVYETLIRDYSEKQWGRPCSELPASIIRRLPVRLIYDNNYFNDRYQGIPEDGYTAMIARMLEGIEVKLETDFLADREGWMRQAKAVLYTGPIDAFYDYCLGTLQYRSLRFETEDLPVSNYQGNAVINDTGSENAFTRTIEHKHFMLLNAEAASLPHTVVTREYPDNWTPGKEPYYPMGDEENARLYREYAAIDRENDRIRFGGRLGLYRYLDMDDTVRAALDFARAELSK